MRTPDSSPPGPDPGSNFSEIPPSRALHSAADSAPTPRRGEVFDVEFDDSGSIVEAPKSGSRAAGAWFFAALAALFCTYNFGAYVGAKAGAPATAGPFAAKVEKPASLRVQIAGLVKKPGVYTLSSGARLEDALQKAGGALPNADLSALNLADWAVDGSKIEVPPHRIAKIAATPTPVVIIKEVFVTPPQNAPGAASEPISAAPEASGAPLESAPPESASRSVSSAASSGAAGGAPKPRAKPKAGKTSPTALALLRKNPVDLNRASAEQLAVLPGVGPKMAERILAYRHENGGFKSVADLDNVKGIGEKRMATLQDLVKVK